MPFELEWNRGLQCQMVLEAFPLCHREKKILGKHCWKERNIKWFWGIGKSCCSRDAFDAFKPTFWPHFSHLLSKEIDPLNWLVWSGCWCVWSGGHPFITSSYRMDGHIYINLVCLTFLNLFFCFFFSSLYNQPCTIARERNALFMNACFFKALQVNVEQHIFFYPHKTTERKKRERPSTGTKTLT